MEGYAEKYADTLKEEGYDSLGEFKDVTLVDLKELGVQNRHAKRIVKAARAQLA